MWPDSSTALNAGRRRRNSRATSGCVGLYGAPGNGPKPVIRMRSLSLNLNKPSARHARHRVSPAASPMTGSSGHPVNADAHVLLDGGSGILDRPLSRTMTLLLEQHTGPNFTAASPRSVPPPAPA